MADAGRAGAVHRGDGSLCDQPLFGSRSTELRPRCPTGSAHLCVAVREDMLT